MKGLGRLVAAMITPYAADGTPDLAESVRVARFLADRGNDGVVLAGSTGEGTALEDDEKIALFGAVRAGMPAGFSVIAGVGGSNTAQCVRLAREAERLRCDGVLATVPAYVKPTPEGMLRHFGAIAEATALPVIVYNIPGRTAATMQPATFAELCRRHATVVGIKDSTGDLAEFTTIIRDRVRDDVTFWCGDDVLYLPSLAVGGYGLVSVASHVCGRELKAMAEAFDGGDVETAARIHRDLSPLFAALFATTSPIPVKWAMERFGFGVGECRPPLAPIPADVRAALEPLIAPYAP